MQIFNKNRELIAFLASLKTQGTTIGFVPTMGALHEGHLSLIQQSLLENEHTVVSIFVNPTQFNNAEDLEKYPRTLEQDVAKMESLGEKIIVFAPTVEDIYTGKTQAKTYDFEGLEHQMEGQFRPGHFDGVGTIVQRLFEIVTPNSAYFGEKDFQQLQIVKKLVTKQQLNVRVMACPIFREANGLAMSSRNERLSVSERTEAGFIYTLLKAAQQKFATEPFEVITEWVQKECTQHPNFKLEYFIIAEESTLLPINFYDKTKKYRAFIAIYVNNIRLIDNIILN